MDFKKRKLDDNENGAPLALTQEDVRKILEPFSKEQLIDVLQSAAIRHADLLDSIRSVSDPDPALRKLFIRGLSPETTSETLRSAFSPYGELEEAIVIFDKNTAKSKGFGFITFKHVDGAVLALKNPSKKIDGRMTVTQLASAGVSSSNSSSNSAEVALRKIYVGNVPFEVGSERLLEFFMGFGEVEEGPLGFDKSSGKPRGFAFFIYKTEDGARAAVAEPMKVVDGHQVLCKMAVDNNKKGKVQGQGQVGAVGPTPVGETQPSAGVGQFGYNGVYSGLVGSSYALNAPSVPVGSVGGGFGGYGVGVSQYGQGTGDYGALSNAGGPGYRMAPSSVGLGSGAYPNGGPYGLSQQSQAPPMPPRGPPGGMYHQGMPPFY